jgi:hypothetical protein
MFRRVFPLVAMVWMIVLGGAILVGISDPEQIGDPNSHVCIVCGGRTGSSDVADIVVGVLTLALGVAGLIVTLSQRSGVSDPEERSGVSDPDQRAGRS